MTETMNYPMTHQGVRDLNQPLRGGHSSVNVGPNERTASTIGGATLAVFGLSRGGLSGLALAALGGMLVMRGMTGHCSVYAATGMNTAK